METVWDRQYSYVDTFLKNIKCLYLVSGLNYLLCYKRYKNYSVGKRSHAKFMLARISWHFRCTLLHTGISTYAWILSFLAFSFSKQTWFKVLLNWYFIAEKKTRNCIHFQSNFVGLRCKNYITLSPNSPRKISDPWVRPPFS